MARNQPSSDTITAATLRQYWWKAMMTLPQRSRTAPSTHCHIGSPANSCNRTGICDEARTAMMDGTIKKNGPNARANMRVRNCDGSDWSIATSTMGTPNSNRPVVGIQDHWSVQLVICETHHQKCPVR